MTTVWALTWLGQSTALAALTAACVRLPGCRQSAAARHVAWTLALFLSAGLLAWPLVPAATTVFLPAPGPVEAGLDAASSIPRFVLPAPAVLASPWLGWAWALGAVAGLALAARDAWRVVRLKRRAVALTGDETERVGGGLPAGADGRSPRLAWCDELDCAAVLGFFGPVIALPPSQVSSLTDGQSRLVVLHELAHVRRRDDWWALAERVVLALTWFNPAVYWMRRELSLSREMACDEWVVRQTAAPAAYARCLADVAGLRTRAARLRLAAGMAGRRGTLRRRVVGVLAMDGRPYARAAAVAAWLAPLAVCVVTAGLLRLPPVFVVADAPDAAASAQAPSGHPDSAAPAPAGRSADRPGPAIERADRRSASVQRRSFAATPRPAGPAAHVVAAPPAAPMAELTAARTEPGGSSPLTASAVPGAGGPSLLAAATASESLPFQPGGAARWWDRPAAVGGATGAAAATAGRATASFVARAGMHVPQLFNR